MRVELEARNPASIPMPVVSALVAFAAYPEATGAQNLGTVCVSMCEDPNSCPQVADACASDEPQIRGAVEESHYIACLLQNLSSVARLEASAGAEKNLEPEYASPSDKTEVLSGVDLGGAG